MHELDVARLAALSDALEADKAALTDHGVTVPAGTKHDGIAALIRQIRMLLPELASPAENGHVLEGKQYIDGSGNLQTGALVVCDTVSPTEGLYGVAGVGATLEIESKADGSMKIFDFREPNLASENIKSGVRIFGVAGSAKTLRVETGTLTPAEDTQSISIDCTPNAALVTMESADVLADTTKALCAICCVAVNSSYIMDADVFNLAPHVNVYNSQGKIANTLINSASFTDGFSAASTSAIKFAAGCAYKWVAYYFDAIGGGSV